MIGVALGGRGDAGDYRALLTYLADRYANRVVLTFAEIEDIVGFLLPAEARSNREWWATAAPSTTATTQSSAWTSAGRTAVVNLLAKNVVFDRQEPPRR